MRHRSPARWLAPLALFASVVAVAGVIGQSLRPDGRSSATSPGSSVKSRTISGGDRGASGSLAGRRRYTVRPGDTISSVAHLHALPADAVLEAFDLSLSDSLEPGRALELPAVPTEGRSWPRRLVAEPTRAQLHGTFVEVAEEWEIPVTLMEALAWEVSRWDPTLVDEDGEIGVGRLDLDIVAWLNEEVLGERLDPRPAESNITLMAAYLATLLEATGGDHAATLAAWYQETRVPYTAPWDLDVTQFVRRVLDRVADFGAEPPPSATTTTTEPTTTTD